MKEKKEDNTYFSKTLVFLLSLTFLFYLQINPTLSQETTNINIRLPGSIKSINENDLLAEISSENEISNINAEIDGIEIETSFNQERGELRYKAKAQPIPTYSNTKDESKFQEKEVFLVSDEDWHNVLPLVPLAIWTQPDGNIRKYPLLVYHEGSSCLDEDSIIHFSEIYDPTKITLFGNTETIQENTEEFKVRISAASQASSKETLYQNINNLDHYLIYWNSVDSIVYSENDYKTALVASVYSSLINAPLIIEGTELDNEDFGNFVKERELVCIGNPTKRECDYRYNIDEIRHIYLEKTATNKIIFVNYNDLDYNYCSHIRCNVYSEESQCNIRQIYNSLSLLSPILAASKHEVLIFTDAPPTYKQKIENFNIVTDITKNIVKTNNDLIDELSKFFEEGQKLYLTIMSSPVGIADAVITGSKLSDRKVRDNNLDYLAKAEFIIGSHFPEAYSGAFNDIKDIKINPYDDLLYAVDSGNRRIKVMDKNGNLIRIISSGLNNPNSIAFDSDNNLYVTDSGNNRVVIFNSQGLNIGSFGSSGTADGQFNSPLGIAIDKSDDIYIADFGNLRIQKFDSSKRFVKSWNIYVVEGFPKEPVAIETDPEDENIIYILAGQSSSLIFKSNRDGNRLPFYYLPGFGNIYGLSVRPYAKDFTLNTERNFFVMYDRYIIEYDDKGNQLNSLGSTNFRFEQFPGQFSNGSGITLDGSSLYASDDTKIQKFSELKAYNYDFLVGRVYGFTVSDVSFLISSSIFYDEIMNHLYGDKYTSIIFSELEKKDSVYIHDSLTASGYDSRCYLYGYNTGNYPQCTPRQMWPTEFVRSQFILSSSHGKYNSISGIPYTRIGKMDASIYIIHGCNVNDFWMASSDFYPMHAVRKGAVGLRASVPTGDIRLLHGIKYMTGKERRDLGSLIKYGEQDISASNVILLGDPTLKPRSKEVIWN